MIFNRRSVTDTAFNKNGYQLTGSFAKKGYDWWWHNFTAVEESTGKEVPFFVEFFIINPALSPDKVVFGQLPENKEKGIRPCYLMVKAGCWGEHKKQLHRFYAINDVKIKKRGKFQIDAGECFASETHIKGHIDISKEDALAHPEWMCDDGKMDFDLQVSKDIAFNVGYGTSLLFRSEKAFEMYWHAQGMKTYFEGTVDMDGRHYIVKKENCYGYADKNWGSNFTSPWVWLSSNDIYSTVNKKKYENSVFDIGGGCPKVFHVALRRKLLSAFYIEGKQIEFNFSKFWEFITTKFGEDESEEKVKWHVEQTNAVYRMVCDIECEKKDMLFVNYEDPEGHKRYTHLWNGGNGKGMIRIYKKRSKKLVDELLVGHVGCEYGEFDK